MEFGCIINHWSFIDITMMTTMTMNTLNSRKICLGISLASVCIVIFSFYNLKVGAMSYRWSDVWYALLHVSDSSLPTIDIIRVRLPIVLMCLIAGSSLAIAGFLLQRLTRNPLACPSLLGIEYGTAFFVVLSYLYMPQLNHAMVLVIALLGGSCTYFLMQLIIIKTKATIIGITLAGVAFNTLYYSLIQAVLIAFPYQAQAILYDLNGCLQNISLADIQLILLPFIILFLIAFLLARRLPLLDLDEIQARSSGVPVKYYRLALLAISIFLTTIITSFTGPLLFFGLIIPHLVRPFAKHHDSIFACATFGAAFLLIAECLTNVISPQTPPPVGLVALLMGSPILLMVVRRYFRYVVI